MKVGAVIPCYKVSGQILSLLRQIGPGVTRIYVVDDCCPEQTALLVERECSDPRVVTIRHEANRGVGGAVITGYERALLDGMDVIVKLDGDGQMNPALISRIIKPIISGRADYTKGNRFFSAELLSQMPPIRVFGNSVLSFVSKAASGYWNIMDPTNGFTAIHSRVLAMLPLEKLSKRYFFESDMLFRLNTLRAVVVDIPMPASYGDEISNLSLKNAAFYFPLKYGVRFFKRIFYNYFLRDFNMCSVQLLAGASLFGVGLLFGLYTWYLAFTSNTSTPIGTVMLASLPIIIGFQLLLSALTFDAMNIPKEPLHTTLDLD